ncbi:hypothetical protein COF81_21430 [Bacillus pseudomycoides]|uniref:Uncharacterized protein n=1 Tax=Bacillus pseudomycoides TaxID=64104 RepID=A0ABD6T429_9BACI|nr:hypothetical protein [Bacillus pseudomycoides]PHE91717.1 hypothetical protein COF81_21430 [Bacillus pseudomycoides]
MKRMKKMIPAAFVLSTALFVAPGFSSADGSNTAPVREKVSLVNSSGQQLTETQQTNDFKSLIPLPNNPNDLFPTSTSSYVKDGNIVDYAYLSRNAQEDKQAANGSSIGSETLQWGSIVVLPDGKVVHAEEQKNIYITKDGYRIEDIPNAPEHYEPWEWGPTSNIIIESFNKGQKLYTIGLSKEYIQKTQNRGYPIDAKVKSSYRWDLISQDLVGKNQGMSLAHTVRHGMSHEVQVGLSYTLGMEVGLEGIASVNQSITASFGYTFGMTQEVEETRTFYYNPITDYRYPYYRGAIYQGKVKYSVEPNEKFKEFVNSDYSYGIHNIPGSKLQFQGEQEVPVNMFAIVNSQ